MVTVSQMSWLDPLMRVTEVVFYMPKPEPVTVIRVPPELPLDGEMPRRTGSIVAVVKLMYCEGRPSAIRSRMFLEYLSLALMTLK